MFGGFLAGWLCPGVAVDAGCSDMTAVIVGFVAAEATFILTYGIAVWSLERGFSAGERSRGIPVSGSGGR